MPCTQPHSYLRTQAALGSGRLSGVPPLGPRARALAAVSTTVCIIKASEVLELAGAPARLALPLLFGGCTLQWALLDGAFSSAALALLAAVGGPLAELPFLRLGAWHYLPEACDYFPLGLDTTWAGLAAITAPCYFAVTTDAIALGRYFASTGGEARDSR